MGSRLAGAEKEKEKKVSDHDHRFPKNTNR